MHLTRERLYVYRCDTSRTSCPSGAFDMLLDHFDISSAHRKSRDAKLLLGASASGLSRIDIAARSRLVWGRKRCRESFQVALRRPARWALEPALLALRREDFGSEEGVGTSSGGDSLTGPRDGHLSGLKISEPCWTAARAGCHSFVGVALSSSARNAFEKRLKEALQRSRRKPLCVAIALESTKETFRMELGSRRFHF